LVVPVIHKRVIRHVFQPWKLTPSDLEEGADVREKSLRAGRVVILFAAIVERKEVNVDSSFGFEVP
jgi:hypothetical protein